MPLFVSLYIGHWGGKHTFCVSFAFWQNICFFLHYFLCFFFPGVPACSHNLTENIHQNIINFSLQITFFCLIYKQPKKSFFCGCTFFCWKKGKWIFKICTMSHNMYCYRMCGRACVCVHAYTLFPSDLSQSDISLTPWRPSTAGSSLWRPTSPCLTHQSMPPVPAPLLPCPPFAGKAGTCLFFSFSPFRMGIVVMGLGRHQKTIPPEVWSTP